MNKWEKKEAESWSFIVTSVGTFGTVVGSLCSGAFTKYGKKRMIVLFDFALLTVIGICMVNNIYVIVFGRFWWGFFAGGMSVFGPKYLNEFLPIELKGSYGGFNPLMLTIGIMVPSCFSVAIPEDPVNELKLNPNNFMITGYWRIIWLIAAVITLIQIVFLSTCFDYETPIDLLRNDKHQKLDKLLKKMYCSEEAVQQKKDDLNSLNSS